jgi:hypothetical protein
MRRTIYRQRRTATNFCRCFAARTIALALFQLGFFAGSIVAANADSNANHWVSVSEAQVKLDDKTPLGWNVYQIEKKNKKDKKDSNLVLILLGHRYLLLDTHTKVAYEVPLTALKAQAGSVDSGDLAQQSRVIPTTDWSSRDVGPAEIFQLTLGDYGRVLQISLPHPPDLRPFY